MLHLRLIDLGRLAVYEHLPIDPIAFPVSDMRDHVWVGVPIAGGLRRLGDSDQVRAALIADIVMARCPVTVGEYGEFVRQTGYGASDSPLGPIDSARLGEHTMSRALLDSNHLADHPMTWVTITDAQHYADWLGAKQGLPLRLPTSDEWEAVARHPDDRAFPWGEYPDSRLCNAIDSGHGGTSAVMTYPDGVNGVGLFDLAGNVWEWTSTVAPDSGWHHMRGGCYLDWGWDLRLANVLEAHPARPMATTGFRLCHSVFDL